ncbi:signal recognition particle-docking protein FtsY [Streptococcus pantholopis]|uniref:Signal recognition particle receptor FtsY n=1 Tax=Streptococcus pantholopis TaxID=1811193 RepID=A0A172Q694_9STRE|nr:signal recognition particle-docking protein FtsY [Streptococcus pantholopis]AND78984.1 signal recognition particle-docking protein FtsY [Streptococcus pantholopis]
MGLFDRLFGSRNKKEEDSQNPAESGDKQQEETVPESADTADKSGEAAPFSSDAEAQPADTDRPKQAENIPEEYLYQGREAEGLTETSPEKQQPQLSANDAAEKEQESYGTEEAEDKLSQAELANQEISDDSADDEANQAAADFMANYYAQKKAIEKAIADGTYVKPQKEKQSDSRQEDVPSEQPTAAEESSESKVSEEQAETKEEKYNRSLKKTRTGFSARLNAFLANFRRVDEDFFEELEEVLILSDVGVNVASTLSEELRYEARLENAKKPEDLKRVIIEKLVDIYEKDDVYNEKLNFQEDLTVMLFVGVNGVGKTTSIGKLAYRYKQEGKKVMMVAADTFRAGAVAQLVEWGRRVDVPVITGAEKADPASVVYDGVERAVAEDVDVLLIDTAGRLQNKDNLMAELEKIGRIIKRVLPDAPHETLLALDASTGQNALSQAKEFSKILPLTGLILTKIDGTAKGGVVLAIRQELDIPVKLLGFGEKIDDIGEFNSEDFMRGLLEGIF